MPAQPQRLRLPAAIALLGCLTALVLAAGPLAQAPTGRHGLLSLPLPVQSAVSAALGHDEPAYRVLGLRADNPAQRLGVAFLRGDVIVSSGEARLGLSLSAYGYASALRPLAAVAPRVDGNRVSYPRRSLTEWYANGPLGLEQGFDVAARPRSGGGPLTLSLAVGGDLRSRLERGSVLLTAGGVALRYGDLLVTDARGRQLPAWLQLARGHMLIRVDDRRAAYPLRIDPLIQQAELAASDGHEGDQLGYSVTISGDTIVAGAPFHKVGSNAQQGAAYVFTMRSGSWAGATQAAKLTASDGAEGEAFGYSVAISGDTIVVGAPFHAVGSDAKQGAAYVFTMPSSGWTSATQTAELTASDGAKGDGLGYSVALSGDTIVAGAPFHTVGSHAQQGAAYAFTMPAGGWTNATQTAELTASDGGEDDGLGSSMSIYEDTIVAGAPFHSVGSHAQQGAAYTFSMAPGGWANATQTAELTASDGGENDGLGSAVAIYGDTIAAGAPLHSAGANADQGAVYVFALLESGQANADQTAELTATDGAREDRLGSSVAMYEDTIVAGAPYHQSGFNLFQGAAYMFSMPAGGWVSTTQGAELTAPDGEGSDQFGSAVAVRNETVLAGAPNHLSSYEVEGVEIIRQGASYVFSPPAPSISIAAPTAGTVYTQGQRVAASYACTAHPGASVSACAGTAADGAAIPTTTTGAHTFTVSATDSEGHGESQSVSYTVVAAPALPPKPSAAPVIHGLHETTKSWREGDRLAKISAMTAPKKAIPVGTTFSFSLNEPASVAFDFTQAASGRQVGKACVAPSSHNAKDRPCARTVIAGALAFSAQAGVSKVNFNGLISKQKRLKLGAYSLVVGATASGKHSSPATLRFTIVG